MLPTHQIALLIALLLSSIMGNATWAAPAIETQLRKGKLAEAERMLADHLAVKSEDDLARFQLGSVRLLLAAEQLSQEAVRRGALANQLAIPFVRVGGFSSGKSQPEPVTYDDIRDMIARFQKSVAEAEATLATIEDTDLYWELDFGKVALDLNGDGQLGASEKLDNLFRLTSNRRRRNNQEQPVVVGFDSADVYWMRGYCHLLQALADMTLAYDHRRLFDLTAHAFFADPQTEYARERDDQRGNSIPRGRQFWGGMEEIADLVAAIHLMDFKLVEARRMNDAREHLLSVVQLSRQSWDLIAQETDNRNELIPGPKQTSVIPDMQVGPEQIEAWASFLDEAEALLNGEKLLPFWRSGFDQGVNMKQVFADPRDADLILWLQGTAALPYLEEGEQTRPEFWRDLQRTFRGRFLGFALWTN